MFISSVVTIVLLLIVRVKWLGVVDTWRHGAIYMRMYRAAHLLRVSIEVSIDMSRVDV